MTFKQVTGHAIRLTCKSCGLQEFTDTKTFYADLDGEPFKAYYCDDCIPEGAS